MRRTSRLLGAVVAAGALTMVGGGPAAAAPAETETSHVSSIHAMPNTHACDGRAIWLVLEDKHLTFHRTTRSDGSEVRHVDHRGTYTIDYSVNDDGTGDGVIDEQGTFVVTEQAHRYADGSGSVHLVISTRGVRADGSEIKLHGNTKIAFDQFGDVSRFYDRANCR